MQQKKSEVPKITGRTVVLKEAVYGLEFASILTAWFPDTISITPEANCDSNEADIFIKYDPLSIVLEFCANERYGGEARKSSFLGHVVRANHYAASLNATSVCVMHFYGVENFSQSKEAKDPPSPMENQTFAYIFHKHDLTDMRLKVWAFNSAPKEYTIKFKDQGAD